MAGCLSMEVAMKKAGIYARVSTLNGQTTKNQIRELEEVAQKAGWELTGVYDEQGVSGAKGRGQRPELDKLLKAVTRREIDVVMAWSVDRLGRSLTDLVGIMQEIRGAGRDLYLHKQGLDTSTPAGKAMFGMLGVFAEFERDMIRERVQSGLARARAEGKRLGRPTLSAETKHKVHELKNEGESIRGISRKLKIGKSSVQRILKSHIWIED
jgi:DNA invertase Pin-like site-specific DNA recombinase